MSRPLATSLSADPRIESLELRRELARTRARWHLVAWVVVVAALGVLQWQLHETFAILLGIAAAALGVAWDRWQSATADDERIEQDLRALTTVYHESPLTIRKWLTSEFIDDSIRNLLAAALDSEELAHGYWKQAVMPFVAESQRGFKSGWRYEIDLIDLEQDVPMDIEGRTVAMLERDRYRKLHSSVTYMQRIPDPAELYYVAVVFEGADLPAWFKKPNFLLREVVVMPGELIAQLPERPLTDLPDRFEAGPAAEALQERYATVARQVLGARVSIGEEHLAPVSLHVDRTGVSWGFRLSGELQERLRDTAEVSVVLDTFMSRRQHYFPVVMGAPTRHPTVQFNYSLTDIASVETEVFFSAERPWDARLRTKRETLRRVEVMTEPDDWVFAGSGCIFTWAAEPRLALPPPGDPSH